MLELQHVSYDVNDEGGNKEILKDISLTIEDGDFLVVTGPNGGGKSSLAKVIMGINKPTGGKVSLTARILRNWILPGALRAASASRFRRR